LVLWEPEYVLSDFSTGYDTGLTRGTKLRKSFQDGERKSKKKEKEMRKKVEF